MYKFNKSLPIQHGLTKNEDFFMPLAIPTKSISLLCQPDLDISTSLPYISELYAV